MEAKKVSDEDIRVSISKDDTERLRVELGRTQTVLDKAQIDSLPREKLLEYVFQIRRIADQTESVKHKVEGFNPKVVKKGGAGAEVESAQGSSEITTILVKMIQEMEQRRIDDMTRGREEESKREKLRIEEETKKDKLREEDILRKEKREEDRRQEMKLYEERLKALQEEKYEKERGERDKKDEKIFESIKMLQSQHIEKLDIDQKRVTVESEKREVRLGKIRKLLVGVLTPMPKDAVGISLYMARVDEIFKEHSVQDDLKISLLYAHVNEGMKRMLDSLSLSQRDTYEKWRDVIIKYCRVTPKLCRISFLNAVRTPSETHIQFACRLRNLFKCYIESREVNQNIEDLIAVLIADRYKASLVTEDRLYLCDKELEIWKQVDSLAHMMDAREVERGYRLDKPRRNVGKDQKGSKYGDNKYKTSYSNQNQVNRNGTQFQAYGGRVENKFATQNRSVPSKNGNGGRMFQKSGSEIKTKQDVYKTRTVEIDEQEGEQQIENQEQIEPEQEEYEDEEEEEVEEEPEEKMVNKVAVTEIQTMKRDPKEEKINVINQNELTLVDSKLVNKAFKIQVGQQRCLAICDSGAQISVLQKYMVTDHADEQEKAQVKLQGAFGDGIIAELRNVSVSLVGSEEDDKQGENVVLTCALTDQLKSKYALITVQDYSALLKQNKVCRPTVVVNNVTNTLVDEEREQCRNELIESLEIDQIELSSLEKGDKLLEESLKIELNSI